MKRNFLYILSLVFALAFFVATDLHAQTCCPVKTIEGTRDAYKFNTSGDNITSQTKRDNDEDWATITNYNASQYQNNHDYFLYVTATSSRSVNADDRMVLCWWLGTSTAGKTKNYSGVVGPPEGTYYLIEPFAYEFGPYYYGYSYDYFYFWGWKYGQSPSAPALVQYKKLQGNTNSGYVSWPNPFSSYVHPRNNSVDYMSFNTARVEVSTGDNGQLFIACYINDECEPRMTIGSKTDPNVNALTTLVNGSGTVSVSPTCEYHTTGETITLTPTPANASICFRGWTGDDASYVVDNGNGTYRMTMQARDMSVMANFGSCEVDSILVDTVCEGTVYDLAYLKSLRPYLPAAQVNTFTETKRTPNAAKAADTTAVWTGKVSTTDGVTNYTIKVLTAKTYALTESRTFCYSEEDDSSLRTFWQTHNLIDPSTNNHIDLPAAATRPVTLTAQENFTSIYGCDSIYTYTITINPITYGTATKWICSNTIVKNGFTWWGNTYHSIADIEANPHPTHTFTHPKYGCDSIVTLDINICYADTAFDTVRVCSLSDIVYQWDKATDGRVQKTADDIRTYMYHGKAVQVIDSIVGTKWDCLFADEGAMTDPSRMLFCDSVWYLVVQEMGEPEAKTATVTVCEDDMADLSSGWQYTFDAGTAAAHIITVTDTASLPKNGGLYVVYDTARTANGCDSARYALSLNIIRPVTMSREVRYRCVNDNEAGDPWYIEGWAEHNNNDEYEMMTTPGLYTDIRSSQAGGCDSLIYTLEIIEVPAYAEYSIQTFGMTGMVREDFDTRIKDTLIVNKGEVVTWSGKEYSSAVADTIHDTYVTYTTIGNCDSIRMLTLIVVDNIGHVYDTICGGEEYVWRKYDNTADTICTTSGDYSCLLESSHQTDSIAILHLTVQTVDKKAIENIMICAEGSYDWPNHPSFTNLTVSGTYGDTLRYTTGCDSIIYTLRLQVLPTDTVDYADTICYGTTYTDSHFTDLKESNVYTRQVTYPYNTCVQTVYRLTLTVLPEVVDSVYSCSICPGTAYSDRYFDNLTTADTYTTTVPFFGTSCDSVRYQLTLSFLPNPVDSSYTRSIVAGSTYSDAHFSNLSVADTYTATQSYYNQTCDSVRYHLTLTTVPVDDRPLETAHRCSNEGAYFWQIDDWAEHNLRFANVMDEGMYFDTLRSISGADSVRYSLQFYVYQAYTLQSGVTPEYDVDTRVRITRYINKGESYFFDGKYLTEEGEYMEFGKTLITECDSVTILTLHVWDPLREEEHIYKCSNEFPFEWNGLTIAGMEDEGKEVTLQSVLSERDSVVTLRLHLLQSREYNDTVVLCQNQLDDYRWNGIAITSEEQGNGQQVTLTTAEGCDSVVTLVLTVHPVYLDVKDAATICYSELAEFMWEGYSFTDRITEPKEETQTASITANLTTVDQCDSIVTFTLTVHPAYDHTDEAVLCYDELAEFTWEGETFTDLIPEKTDETQVVTRTKTLRSIHDCDSIVTFTLTVHPTFTHAYEATICASELPYTLGSETFTKAETRVLNLKTIHGCDSIVTFTLHVLPTYSNVKDSSTICFSELARFRWEGYAFTDLITKNTGLTQRATRTETIRTKAGCDSTVAFTLIVHPTYSVIDNRVVCATDLPFEWEGNRYNQNTTVTRTLRSRHGCDSVVTLNLEVIRSVQRNQTDEVCDNFLPYVWTTYREQYLTESGSYRDVQKSVTGCDSVIYTLNLTVYSEPVTGTALVETETLCPDQDNLVINFTPTGGRPASYDLLFDDLAHSQYFTDLSGMLQSSSSTRITVNMPQDVTELNSYPQADNYTATLVVTDRCDKQTSFRIAFSVLYPASLIVQKWNDVLALYNEKANGGQTFTSIRWFQNNIPIDARGEHNSYIYQLPNLAFGEPYYVEVTRASDGKTFRTCDFYPQRKSDTPQNSGERVRVMPHAGNDFRLVNIQSDTEGEYVVYDVTGKQLMQGRFGAAESNNIVFSKQYPAGTYILRFQCSENTVEIKKWLVH